MAQNSKQFIASGAVERFRIVYLTAAEDRVAAAPSKDYPIVGVAADVRANDGERQDVVLSGVAAVTYGGTIAAGDLITAGAGGVALALAAGSSGAVLGRALVAGVSGDIGQVLLAPGQAGGGGGAMAATNKTPSAGIVALTDADNGTEIWVGGSAAATVRLMTDGLAPSFRCAVVNDIGGAGAAVSIVTYGAGGTLISPAGALAALTSRYDRATITPSPTAGSWLLDGALAAS